MRKPIATPRTAEMLHALANERRLAVVELLGRSERSVGELERLVGISQSALSQHLALLRGRELVDTRREAQTIYYRLSDPAVRQVIETLMKIYCPEMLK